MGQVHQATDTKLNRQVALKIPSRLHLSTPFHKFVHVCLMRQSSVTSGGRVWRATGPSRAA